MTEFTVNEVTVFIVLTFWTKHFARYVFLEIYKILAVWIWTAKFDFNKK